MKAVDTWYSRRILPDLRPSGQTIWPLAVGQRAFLSVWRALVQLLILETCLFEGGETYNYTKVRPKVRGICWEPGTSMCEAR